MRIDELNSNQIERFLKAKTMNDMIHISRELGISIRTAYYWRKRLKENISKEEKIKENTKVENRKPIINKNKITIGLIGDTHINSFYERLDLLNEAYEIFEERGIKIVLHAGNIIDGYSRLNAMDVKYTSVDRQIKYLAEVYPRFSGKTYFITADEHESWSANIVGLNVGERIHNLLKELGRDDFEYIGSIESDMILANNYRIRVVHPGGGVTKGISLRFQQLVEDYEENDNKPDMLVVGHYHKMLYMPWRGVDVIGVPSFQDTNRYFKKKRIKSQLGFWIVVIDTLSKNIILEPRYFDHIMSSNKGVWINKSIVNDNIHKEIVL